jgi:xanthine dehydrogenase accessory factor
MPLILVRGVNDVGSAVAHRLFTAGHAVAIHDGPRPTATRRKMAFADAVFDGRAELEGVVALLVNDPVEAARMALTREVVAVFVGELSSLLDATRPAVLIDARMRKRAQPEDQRGLAGLTIGLGPNFVAGETSDLVVETSWEDLGRVIDRGASKPLVGEPRAIGGAARERYVYAPVEGLFRTALHIGDTVHAGQGVASIGETVLTAPIDGVLRGLTHDRVPVAARTKVIEVDPRGLAAQISGIGERPGRIADGVLASVERWSVQSPFAS